jgi:RNA polymerase sigma-70 factor (ECF subfamily)
MSRTDPTAWLDDHGDALFRYAMVRVRNPVVAEDLVQETLLAALVSAEHFAARSSERTWLVGILKHKLIDHFRRSSRETTASDLERDSTGTDDHFRDSGEWVDHWRPSHAPSDWEVTPATAFEQTEFWRVFDTCLDPLPERTARAFTLREIDGLETAEICEILDVTTSNLWVMLHRARLRLRRCIEVNWFRREAVAE